MRNLIIIGLLLLGAFTTRAQILNLGGQEFPLTNIDSIIVVELVDTLYVDATVYITESRFISELDTTVISSYGVPIPSLLKSELNSAVFNSMWNAQARLSNADAALYEEDDIENVLDDVFDPLMEDLTGDGYRVQSQGRFLTRFSGYYTVQYDVDNSGIIDPTEIFDMYITQDSVDTIFEIETATDSLGTYYRRKPAGLSGTLYILNVKRWEVVDVFAESVVRVSQRKNGTFARKQRNVVLAIKGDQDIRFINE